MAKIVFFDIDGTLYSSGIGILDSTIEAVNQLIENGHKAVMCTGRSKGMMPEEYFHMGFHGMILGAGTYVAYEGEMLHHQLMNQEEVQTIIQWGKQQDAGIILEGDKSGYYDPDNFCEYYREMVQRTQRDTGTVLRPLNQAEDILKWTYHHLEVDKISDIERILDYKVKGTFHEPTNSVEFLPAGINKAVGIQKILAYSGISRQDTYAFGDSANDIEMLQYVNYGIAMGNAVPELLQKANYRTARADEDGIALGLKKFGLID